MRKTWMLLLVGLIAGALTLGAVACSDNNDNDGGNPTATQGPAATSMPEEPTSMEEPTAMEEATSAPSASATVIATENAELGTILTTSDGYTLYVFDNDSEGVSACTGSCADLWPPLTAAGTPTAGDGVSGTLDVITRDDGSMQVTLDGQPLYLYSGDAAPGDTTGDGFGGVWHAVTLG